MTAQMPDFFEYQDKHYCIVGWTGGKLATAQDFGMRFLSGSMADARGHCLWYGINNDNMLVVKSVEIRGTEHESSQHNYQQVKRENRLFYENINHIAPLTGYVLISEHMKLSHLYDKSPYELFEIEIKHGKIIAIHDIGEATRQRLKDRDSSEIPLLDSSVITPEEAIQNLETVWNFTSTVLPRRYDYIYIIALYFRFKEYIAIERSKIS